MSANNSLSPDKMEKKAPKKPFNKKEWRKNKYCYTAKVQKAKEIEERKARRKYLKFRKREQKRDQRMDNANTVPLGKRLKDPQGKDGEEGPGTGIDFRPWVVKR